MTIPKTENASPEPCALGEFGRIARYLRPLAAGCPGALNLTDDAAVLPVPPGYELVVTTDAMVAGIHFFPDDSPDDIAAKLLRVNLSDLAAMGAAPFAYTLVLALPPTLQEDWLAAFCAGLKSDQARYGIPLAGGDSVSTPGPITLSVTALGLVPCGRALTRRVRGPVDRVAEQRVFVTGTIGDAALGLALAEGRLGSPPVSADAAAMLIARLRRPEPRLGLGLALRDMATAAIDISDGLIADLGHIAEVTGCSAIIEGARLPLSAAARSLLDWRPDLLASVVGGGDDYELVFTAPAGDRATVAALAAQHGVAITEIGRLTSAPTGQVEILDFDGQPLALTRRGWNHFTGADRPVAMGTFDPPPPR